MKLAKLSKSSVLIFDLPSFICFSSSFNSNFRLAKRLKNLSIVKFQNSDPPNFNCLNAINSSLAKYNVSNLSSLFVSFDFFSSLPFAMISSAFFQHHSPRCNISPAVLINRLVLASVLLP